MGSTPPCRLGYSRYRNHPHEYGEYIYLAPPTSIITESPPCVWGVRTVPYRFEPRMRITPMCMGSTARPRPHLRRGQNHPHVYGEYESIQNQKDGTIESPPCVWGVPTFVAFLNVGIRITPMCMGSTLFIKEDSLR